MTLAKRRELTVQAIQFTLGNHAMSLEFAQSILKRLPAKESDLDRDPEVSAFVESVRTHFFRLVHSMPKEDLP